MTTDALAGIIGFVVFFGMWVIVPPVIKRRHENQADNLSDRQTASTD